MRIKNFLGSTVGLLSLLCAWGDIYAQDIIIQQNNNSPSKNQEKVIEKKVYVEKPVYIEKQSPKPTSPVCIMGYLYVFPETFYGTMDELKNVILELNTNMAYGSSNWRLPTMAELQILYSKRNMLPEIMDYSKGYISSEYVKSEYWYGTYYRLYKILDPSGKNWSFESGVNYSGTAIIVHK